MTVKQKQEYNKRIIKWGIIAWVIVIFFIFLFYFFSNGSIREINSWGDIVSTFTGSFWDAMPYIMIATFAFFVAWGIRGEEKRSIGLELDGADLPQLYQWRILIDATIRNHENYHKYRFDPRDYYIPHLKNDGN